MALRERLIYAIEFVHEQSSSGLNKIKADIAGADGVVGKFKAGATSAFSAVTGNAALMATGVAGAAAAIGAFGAKAVTAFTELAKKAIDLHTSTGLNIEDASRWIAVADDYEVTAESLATGLGKVAKTLDSTKWQKYGIETRDAAGKARDVNDILLDTFDMLSKVTNETERARIGQELFGKGYQSLTPLLGHTRAEYEKLLATQQEGQVITEAEAKKAEETRLAMDNLHDTLNEITLALGQSFAPAVADAANDIAQLVTWFLEAKNAVTNLTDKIPGLTKALNFTNPINGLHNLVAGIGSAGNAIKGIFGKGGDAPEALEYTSSQAQALIQSSIDLAAQEREVTIGRERSKEQVDRYVQSLIDEHDAHATEIRVLEGQREARSRETEQAEAQRRASEDVADALDKERAASIRLVGGDIAIREAKRDAQAAYQAYTIAVRDGTIAKGDEQAAVDKVATAYINQAQTIAENKLTMMEANGDVVNAAVQQQVLRDSLQETANGLNGPFKQALLDQIALLDEFERPRTAQLQIVTLASGTVVSSNPGLTSSAGGRRVVVGARGAVVNRRIDGVTIGEDGPEVVTPLDEMPGASPLGNGDGSGGDEVHYHLHVGALIHESQLGALFNRLLTTWQRNGGRVTFTTKGN